MEREAYIPVKAEVIIHANPESDGQLFQWVCEKLEQEGTEIPSGKGEQSV